MKNTRWLQATVALGACMAAGCAGEETTTSPTYPEGPYGTEVGAVVANLAFDGWQDPQAADYDPAALARIDLGDLHDPDGSAGIDLIVINACSTWCPPCNQTYREDLPARQAEYHDRGVRLLATVSQGMPGEAITTEELVEWATTLDVAFPLAADPTDQLGAFMNADAAPNWVVVNARDMRVLGLLESTPASGLWSFVDQKLAQLD